MKNEFSLQVRCSKCGDTLEPNGCHTATPTEFYLEVDPCESCIDEREGDARLKAEAETDKVRNLLWDVIEHYAENDELNKELLDRIKEQLEN